MHASKRFASSFGMLAGISRLTLGVFLGLTSSCALDDGSAADPSVSDGTAADDGGAVSSESVCNGGRIRCHAHIRTFGAEHSRSPHAVSPLAVPSGYGPADLQSAYGIDPTKLATTAKPIVAITDAYGYPNLEADLAMYRQTYNLPPCTSASGCLKIVDQQGMANLPSPPPAGDDWTIETALDVDMISAACPLCNILVVQATDDQGDGLDVAQNTAATLHATVISDSWGSAEQAGEAQTLATSDTTYYQHPGIAIFVASGDNGWDDTIQPPATQGQPARPTGPGYPATSQYTIAVGGTNLAKAPGTLRGWTETAWAVTVTQGKVNGAAGAGGSGCSLSIPKPAYQTASPCTTKANSDISAVADPNTGVAVYNTNGTNKGWGIVGGTSAASPFVAAVFAATGNGNQTSGKFIADNASKLNDVTLGTNGTCTTGQELVCNAKAGWDGPTGFGTPNAKLLMATATGPGTGGGNGNGNGNGSADGTGGGSGSNDASEITGGCQVGGSGAGLLLGVALLGLRRRRR
jgi:subtilase family serine protease